MTHTPYYKQSIDTVMYKYVEMFIYTDLENIINYYIYKTNCPLFLGIRNIIGCRNKHNYLSSNHIND